MNKTPAFKIMATLSFATLTACSPYSQSDDSSLNSLADLTCTTTNCVTPTTDNLAIKVNLGGGSQYAVKAGLADFNLGGTCNEGGFAYNVIQWDLVQDDTKAVVRSSTSMGANSACVNGRFLLYINLASATADPVNRAGLLGSDGVVHSYRLRISIFGQNTYGGALQTGANNAAPDVSLLPAQ